MLALGEHESTLSYAPRLLDSYDGSGAAALKCPYSSTQRHRLPHTIVNGIHEKRMSFDALPCFSSAVATQDLS